MSVFQSLNAINVNGHTEKKNGLTYLSWAWAWAEVKKIYPDATYKVYEREDGCIYWTDGRTCWVKTGVTIDGLEHIEYLPIMDFKNKSIGLEAINSMDVNKAIQRSLTKCCARHGLGLYIYAGEDLPEAEQTEADLTGLRLNMDKKCQELAEKSGKELNTVRENIYKRNEKNPADWNDKDYMAAIVQLDKWLKGLKK